MNIKRDVCCSKAYFRIEIFFLQILCENNIYSMISEEQGCQWKQNQKMVVGLVKIEIKKEK
jgi:hypothetical protein